MNVKDDIITIIVPVYNVEKYLDKCLDSILKQTYEKIELILIDDGSTDDSGKICDEYAKKDSRVVALHKKNAGVSEARNIGIKNSNGKYIMFVDSDDYIERDMVEIMYYKIIEKNADIVICDTNNVDENGKIYYKNIENEEMILDNVEALRYMLDEKIYNGVCWGKLYKRELFTAYKFNKDIKIAEDLEVLYKIFFYSNTIVYIPEKKYNWLVRKDSVTKENFNEKWIGEIKICEEIIKFIEKKCNDIMDYAIKRYIRINVTCAINIIRNNGKKENLEYLQKNIKKYKIKNKKILENIDKVKIFLVLYLPWVAKIVMNLKK